MLAQWVPLHAVSCSNLIETGECAESREIPLRVTQTGCCSRDLPPLLRIARSSRSREPFASRRRVLCSALLFFADVPGLNARSSTYPRSLRSRSRLWIAILGTPAFFRANFRPREIADDRLTECCHRKLPSRHLTTRTFDPAGRTVV